MQSLTIFEDLSCRGRGQGQGLENWSSRILENKDFPRGKQHCLLESITFWFVDQSMPNFLPKVGGVADDQELLRFSICWSFPEIFAIKVESCQKWRTILGDFLAVKNFWRRALQKLCPFYHLCLTARRLKKSHGDTPTSPEVTESNRLNFRPDF